MTKKVVLDVTAGLRSMWFDKNNPIAVFLDKDNDVVLERRRVDYQKMRGMLGRPRKIKGRITNATVVGDFRHLEFADETFQLVVFDPPHLQYLKESSLFGKRYGQMEAETWPADLHAAFREMWRVLKPYGVLIFKWNDHDIPFKQVLRLAPERPLFGQISGGAKNRNGHPCHTCWFCFLKVPIAQDS
jgi:SAM-dependent methyltransferase